jgi:antitoxin MazE
VCGCPIGLAATAARGSTCLEQEFLQEFLRLQTAWPTPVSASLTRLAVYGSLYIVDTWRDAVRATVKKWGNSAAVRIPASVMQATRLTLDEVVDVREEAGRIVIEPVRQKTYELEELLKGITSKNQHTAIDFGAAVGKEAW